MAELRSQVFDDRVLCLHRKVKWLIYPWDQRLSMLYAIHSEIGHRCIGAKVGRRIIAIHLSPVKWVSKWIL